MTATVDRLDARELLKSAMRLPPLPAIAMQVVKVSNDPRTAAEDISRLLALDQSLSARILRMVNSSYYASRSEVSSIRQAVVILGFETVRTLTFSTAIMDRFSSDDGAGAPRAEFWKHALGVAMTARVIARHQKRGREQEELAYMAGLLHDIGKVILDEYFHDTFAEILRRIRERGESFREAERAVNSIGHDEIGAFLALQWGLPRAIANAIRHHHAPMRAAEDASIVDTVHFADILAKTRGVGSGGDDDLSGLSEDSVKRLGLSESDVAVIVEVELPRELDGAKELLALLD